MHIRALGQILTLCSRSVVALWWFSFYRFCRVVGNPVSEKRLTIALLFYCPSLFFLFWLRWFLFVWLFVFFKLWNILPSKSGLVLCFWRGAVLRGFTPDSWSMWWHEGLRLGSNWCESCLCVLPKDTLACGIGVGTSNLIETVFRKMENSNLDRWCDMLLNRISEHNNNNNNNKGCQILFFYHYADMPLYELLTPAICIQSPDY